VIRFVTGTDTGVGKTVVSAALAARAVAEGRSVVYVKPVQTGLPPGAPGDAGFVAKTAGVRAVEGARFGAPLAPAVAAALEGAAVDVDGLEALVRSEAAGVDEVLVEGAGGLLVPLSDDVDGTVTMADFALRIGADQVVVVTRPSLGTLNHTALTVEAARARGIEPVLVVSGWPEEAGLTEVTNLERLRSLAAVMGVLRQVEGLDVEGMQAAGLPDWDAQTPQ
jgi:dethiobiotin synthase